ncbi:MAG TPA: glycosyltransferase family 2 protein [Anaerolineales bacterium]
MPDSDLTIVIPVYNEAESLPRILPELLQEAERENWQVVLVNDGSMDESAQILLGHQTGPNVKVIQHKVNKGYGGALKTGIESAQTSYVLTMDADGQHSLSDIRGIHQFALAQDADMVIGARDHPQRKDAYRELGKWLIRGFTRMMVPLHIRDLNSGFKLYRTEIVQQYLDLCPDTMAFSDVITLLFLHQKHLVLEFPIQANERLAGSSSINTHTALQTVIEILNLVMLVNPLRIFLPLSLVCIAAGLIWGIPIALLGRGVSVGSMLAIVLGALFFFLGLLASQLSSIRLHLARTKNRRV